MGRIVLQRCFVFCCWLIIFLVLKSSFGTSVSCQGKVFVHGLFSGSRRICHDESNPLYPPWRLPYSPFSFPLFPLRFAYAKLRFDFFKKKVRFFSHEVNLSVIV